MIKCDIVKVISWHENATKKRRAIRGSEVRLGHKVSIWIFRARQPKSDFARKG